MQNASQTVLHTPYHSIKEMVFTWDICNQLVQYRKNDIILCCCTTFGQHIERYTLQLPYVDAGLIEESLVLGRCYILKPNVHHDSFPWVAVLIGNTHTHTHTHTHSCFV